MMIEQLLRPDIGLNCRVDGWVTDSRASAFSFLPLGSVLPISIGQESLKQGYPTIFLMGILLFMLLGSPRINLEPYDKPFLNIFENSPFSGQNRVNWGGWEGPRNLIFIGILLTLLLRSPCKNLKSYDNPFYGFE